MDHSRISEEEWDLIKDLKIADAHITKVWRDDNGDIYMELVHEPYVSPDTLLAFLDQGSRRVEKRGE